MIHHARTALLLTAAALLLAACSGWQLRGQTSTPELESITLDGASDFCWEGFILRQRIPVQIISGIHFGIIAKGKIAEGQIAKDEG